MAEVKHGCAQCEGSAFGGAALHVYGRMIETARICTQSTFAQVPRIVADIQGQETPLLAFKGEKRFYVAHVMQVDFRCVIYDTHMSHLTCPMGSENSSGNTRDTREQERIVIYNYPPPLLLTSILFFSPRGCVFL